MLPHLLDGLRALGVLGCGSGANYCPKWLFRPMLILRNITSGISMCVYEGDALGGFAPLFPDATGAVAN